MKRALVVYKKKRKKKESKREKRHIVCVRVCVGVNEREEEE